ncbi:ParB/RepB/Spo0J family partition protein [Streptomyces coeruleorubidus]|uniref:ParB/RepB/Spo0J family partition protein n=1 Tax=Streptomyces coeruleorubidus TaxID=116188 RepID=A0ABZ0KSD8_STRC4|nr:ParB/RepB/Spo0J family partition protein [Streptomyces coeruleorubidus]WOT40700.1 ParB/RepB/Spo0J family partition protein [Streptomyces coeruleorubidus]
MSKADQLGSGRFGGGVRTVSARRQAVAAATGVPTEGIAPPTELPVHRISPNPDNPRSNLGDLTDLAGSLKTHGQKQAITVMNRDAYVKANPEREADLEPDTTHVVVDGSSRLAAARDAGLDTLKVMVSDDQGTTPEELLESALVANIHRQDLEELDEARALQRLLEIHGSQRALAKRLHRSQGWISQRLALLNLSPELQARIGEEPIDLLRAVGNKPVEQQKAALEELKAERAAKEEAARTSKRHATQRTAAAREEDTRGPAGDYGVITSRPEEDSSTDSQDESPRRDGEPSQSKETSDKIPEPRADSRSAKGTNASLQQKVHRVPFDRPGELALLLDVRVETDDAFFTLLELLYSKALDRDPARAGELARSFAEQAAARAG